MILCISLLLLFCTYADATNQLRLLLSPKGQRYGTELAEKIVKKQVMALKIPDVDNKDVTVNGLKILSFESPQISLKAQPPNKLAITTQKGNVRVSGYAKKKDITLIGDVGGNFDVTIDNIETNMVLQFTHVENNLHLELLDCSIDVDISDLQFSGSTGMNALVFVLKPLIKSLAPSFASSAVCTEVKKAIGTIANQKVPEAMSGIKVQEGITLNLAVQVDPTMYQSGFLEVDVLPVFQSETSKPPTLTPVDKKAASDRLESVRNDRMAFVLLSDELLNSVSQSAHAAGLTKYVVAPEAKANHSLFRASCDFPEICIGRIFPDLEPLFRNETLSIDVSTAKPPTFKIENGKLFFNVDVGVALFDPDTDQKAVVLTVGVGGWVSPTVRNNIASVALNITRLEGHVTKSEIAALKHGKLTCALEFVRPIINSVLRGMIPESTKLPIPSEKAEIAVDVNLVKTSLKVAADVTLKLDKLNF